MSDHEIPQLPKVPFKVSIEAGEAHELNMRTEVPEGTERVYFNNAVRGLTIGLFGTGDKLLDIALPDQSLEIAIAKAANEVFRD